MGRKVIELAKAAPDAALLGLNRLTGLSFSTWPESLVNPPLDKTEPQHGHSVQSPTTAAKPTQRDKKQA
jgi:hypothetical protein